MEKTKKLFMTISFVVLLIGLCAGVWMYSVLKDSTSLIIVVLLFLAVIWYGLNVYNLWTKKE